MVVYFHIIFCYRQPIHAYNNNQSINTYIGSLHSPFENYCFLFSEFMESNAARTGFYYSLMGNGLGSFLAWHDIVFFWK